MLVYAVATRIIVGLSGDRVQLYWNFQTGGETVEIDGILTFDKKAAQRIAPGRVLTFKLEKQG